MKIRKEAIILGIVIVVLSLYLIFNKSDRSLYELPELKPVPVSIISKMTIDSSDNSIVFIRKAGAWVVNEEAYPGDETSIKRVADIVSDLTLTTLISESKNYGRYDLDPDHKITVKAWEGDKLVREFDVGKSASGHRHTFVKLAGDHRVYQAKDSFRKKVQEKADMFRYKTVMSFNPDQIERVQVLKKDKQHIYVKEKTPQASSETAAVGGKNGMDTAKSLWKNAAGEVVTENNLNKLIGEMSSLKCSAFIYDRQKADFNNPITTISFKGDEENTLQIFERFEKDASNYPAVSSQNDYPFYIPKWQVDQVIKASDDGGV
ncbi:MAG: DUF4340 domain-containing protein [Desulfobacterales bacterium]|nr:DUF4340 domain-containing protein [Desulfobacterales bacterium]MDX2512224.1 DUF4340 domain-containing protein [Desulfobacterales bacterium]